MSTELKEQIKQELLAKKEEKQKLEIEKNSKLKEITLYTRPNIPVCDSFKKFFTENGIKFIGKDLIKYNEVISTVQISAPIIIFVNEEYLAHGREFTNPQQCVNILRHFASPDYVVPSPEVRLRESIKNLNNNMGKAIQQIARQLTPISRIMNQLAAEDKAEKEEKVKKENAKKNK